MAAEYLALHQDLIPALSSPQKITILTMLSQLALINNTATA
jgi:hypothetical protein